MRSKRVLLVAGVLVLVLALALLAHVRSTPRDRDAVAPPSWSVETTSTQAAVRAVWSTATERYAVGDGGLILHRTNGYAGKWLAQRSGTDVNLRGVGGQSDIYAVGERGTILRRDAGTNAWISEVSGTTEDLNAVTGLTSKRVFVAGAHGTLLVRDGGMWGPASFTDNDLFAVLGGWQCSVSNDAIYVGGANGTIFVLPNYLRPGMPWIAQKIGTNETLRALACDDEQVVAVGAHGVVVRAPIRSLAWTVEQIPEHEDLFSVLVSSRTMLAAGAHGALVVQRDGRNERFDAPEGVDLYGMTPWVRGAIVVAARGYIFRFQY